MESQSVYRVVNSDRWSGATVMLLAIFCLYFSWHLPFGSISAPDAGFFPRTLGVLLFVFGALITGRSVVKSPDPATFDSRVWFIALAAAALVVYALTIQTVGYPIATLLILLLFARGLCAMPWGRSVAIAIPAAALSFFGFSKLGVPLPPGVIRLW